MNELQYSLVMLTSCGINQIVPNKQQLEGIDLEKLYRFSKFHSLDALVGMTVKQAGAEISKSWQEKILKAVRKNILFDVERGKLLDFFEKNGIWYMPLKGILIKDLYPAVGMRQMADNDILFDDAFTKKVQAYMESQGYTADSVGKSNHDVYKKEPVYNFELHRALYGKTHSRVWAEYYKNVKERLVLTEGTSFGYHFTEEDFYIYILTHEYKHYKISGTGLRSLVDVYVCLKAKEQILDFDYIQRECEKLGIAEFERQGRTLCKKVFGLSEWKTKEELEQLLLPEERDMLLYYLTSGVYGNSDQRIKNGVKEFQDKKKRFPKLGYLWNRLFPGADVYVFYMPQAEKHPWLLPIGCVKRLGSVIFGRKSNRIMQEVKKVRKV